MPLIATVPTLVTPTVYMMVSPTAKTPGLVTSTTESVVCRELATVIAELGVLALVTGATVEVAVAWSLIVVPSATLVSIVASRVMVVLWPAAREPPAEPVAPEPRSKVRVEPEREAWSPSTASVLAIKLLLGPLVINNVPLL